MTDTGFDFCLLTFSHLRVGRFHTSRGLDFTPHNLLSLMSALSFHASLLRRFVLVLPQKSPCLHQTNGRQLYARQQGGVYLWDLLGEQEVSLKTCCVGCMAVVGGGVLSQLVFASISGEYIFWFFLGQRRLI